MTDLRPSLTWLRSKCLFLAITIQIVHCIGDKLTLLGNDWQFYTRLYGSTMKRDRYLHILCFLHLTGSYNESEMTDENSDRLWKMRNLFEILNKTLSKFYSSSEHLAVDDVTVLFKRRVIFRQYMPKKQTFWHQNLQTMRRDWIHV